MKTKMVYVGIEPKFSPMRWRCSLRAERLHLTPFSECSNLGAVRISSVWLLNVNFITKKQSQFLNQ